MAMREINTQSNDRLESEQYSFENAGDSVQGVLLEKVTLTSKKNGKTFQKYTVKSTKGGNVSFLGGHQIDKGLADVETGTEIRITFQGIKKLDGGRTVKLYKVEADDGAESAPKAKTKSAAEVIANARVS